MLQQQWPWVLTVCDHKLTASEAILNNGSERNFYPRQELTCIRRSFRAGVEQITTHSASPSKKGFNQANAGRCGSLDPVSGWCSPDSDKKFMVLLIAARLSEAANWLVLFSAESGADARDHGLTAHPISI